MATYSVPEEGTPKKKPLPFPARFTDPVGTPTQVPNNKKTTPKPQPNNAVARRLSRHEQHVAHMNHLNHVNRANRDK